MGFPVRPGSENDESVIMAAYHARQEGLSVLLKPQIWVRGGWPGDLRMENEADWETFFAHYKDWIVHYAFMAELYQFETFCVGVELKYTTLEQPDRWKRLIREIRKVYSGPIVYAANWGEEFEQFSFWEELDYIGIDFYYPLSKGVQFSEKDLRKNLSAALDKVEKVAKSHQKPVLLTEIGFRSIDAPWQMPHDYPGNKEANPEHQALCYNLVLEAIQQRPWCVGIYWWKWPSYLEHTHPRDKDYSPIGKPAEAIVQKWFGGGE